MGTILVTILFFVLGLVVCVAWTSLNSLGLVLLPVSGSLDGVLGLAVCIGFVVGLTLDLVCA